MYIDYGTIEETSQIDENTTETKITKLHEGKSKKMRRFTHRKKVTSQSEELAEYIKFTRDTANMLDTSFSTKDKDKLPQLGFYFIIKSWTEAV